MDTMTEQSEDPHLHASVVIPLDKLFPPDQYALVLLVTAHGVTVCEGDDPIAAYVLSDLGQKAEARCKADPALLAQLDQLRAGGPGREVPGDSDETG